MVNGLFRVGEDLSDLPMKNWYLRCCQCPDIFQIYAGIIVDQAITEPCYLPPGYFGVFIPEIIRDMLRCLADDL